MVACLGCQSDVVKRAVAIQRDAALTCPAENVDRCAIRSEFQDLADSAFNESIDQSIHYVSILDIGEDALLARIHLIRAARESIDLQTFIWDDDEVGQMVFAELLQAAHRGVKVRLILDQLGVFVSVDVMARMATVHENIDIMFFRPVMKQGGKSPTREIGSLITDPKTLNKRMHNKLMVIDDRIGILGGRNIQNTYYDYDRHVCFKDMDLLVVGPEVRDMVRSFNQYWNHKLTIPVLELPDIAGQALRLEFQENLLLFESPDVEDLNILSQEAGLYSIVSSRPTMKLYPVNHIDYVADRPDKKRSSDKADPWDSTRRVEELVTSAQFEVIMQTPYLIQDAKGFRDFKTLREKRPDLRIALSTNSMASTDHFFVYAMCIKQRQFYLEGIGANMYEFKPVPGDVNDMVPRFMKLVHELNEIDPNGNPENVLPVDAGTPRLIVHAKFFVVDDHISFVGSHNFDPRAKNLNTENAVIIWDDDMADALKHIFDRDTAPQNSWVLARRQKIPLVGNVSELIAFISSSLPLFDIWPFEYSSNFELKEGFEPVDSDHPDFYEHYEDVGIFPQTDISYERIGAQFVRAFGGFFRDMM
jgi:phosphatidylserine/phosphatidylglycerophosphate/cardiolipin synthase-like enzyme